MSKLPILVLATAITGCSNLPSYSESTLTVEKEVSMMSRTEIIDAIKECETADLRPVIVQTKRKINNQPTLATVDVTCMPKYR